MNDSTIDVADIRYTAANECIRIMMKTRLHEGEVLSSALWLQRVATAIRERFDPTGLNGDLERQRAAENIRNAAAALDKKIAEDPDNTDPVAYIRQLADLVEAGVG